MSGWFAVSREILDHPIFNGRPDRLYAWIWILSNAAYKDTKQDVDGHIIDVPRGCLCASQAMMQRGTGMSRQALRTFLNLLENANVISPKPATKSTKSRTMITVCNYDKYQASQPNQQPSSNQAATKQQPIKETKKQINNNTPKPPKGAGDLVKILSEVCSEEVAEDFVKHRKAIKAPMTGRAAELIVGKLRGHPSPDAVLCYSIESGWKGVFPEKVDAKQASLFAKRAEKPVDEGQRLKHVAMMIERRIASGVTASQARECIAAGLVTEEQCKGLGVI